MATFFINPFSVSTPLDPIHGGGGGGGDNNRSRKSSYASATGSRSSSSKSLHSRNQSVDSLNGGPAGLLPARRSSTPILSPMFAPITTSTTSFISATVPSYSAYDPVERRRSVDVGVLRLGFHRRETGQNVSRSVRDAVGPDAGDKEDGLIGAGPKRGKDRLLGRHLASILAHSVALCAPPTSIDTQFTSTGTLSAIPGSPLNSPGSSRHASLSDTSSSRIPSFSSDPAPPGHSPIAILAAPIPMSFPVLSSAKRFKLIGNLQSWTFNAMSYTSDELLGCVGIMFESLRNMQGVDFDLEQFKSLLLSLRSAYHVRNGYHNFSHATDVTHACYSFLVRMGLAPPLYLLCEDDYDPNIGEGRRKWRRNRAVEEGGMGELLRPMDVFALMVAAIGHDVGHPGLSNAYMVNARTPLAQVYEDKSVLENFHTVTLIHMLRRHNFDYLLGGGFGHLGDEATSFRKVLERSILSTDMSRHFAFVSQINDMGRRFGENKGASKDTIEDDRLLLCSGLIKCADISNPTRPHRISRAWSTALLSEWAVQATIETDFGLPVSVMCIEPTDTKAQAKSQVGFIDLFAKPLFNAMACVVDEFADFAEKLRDGRTAWEAISLQTDEAYQEPQFKLGAPPSGRSVSPSPLTLRKDTSASPASTPPAIPIAPPKRFGHSARSSRSSGLPLPSHRPGSITSSSSGSPLSPFFTGAGSITSTGASSFSGGRPASLSGFSTFSSLPLSLPLSAPHDSRHFAAAVGPGGAASPSFFPSSRVVCDGQCHTATAQCEGCCIIAQETRRGSLGSKLAGILRTQEDDEERLRRIGIDHESGRLNNDDEEEGWPPFPFRPTYSGLD